MDGIKYVTFAGAVETCDGVKLRIEVGDNSAIHVGFEAFEDDLFDVHSK